MVWESRSPRTFRPRATSSRGFRAIAVAIVPTRTRDTRQAVGGSCRFVNLVNEMPAVAADPTVLANRLRPVLFKLGRYNDAIAAWTRALAGDGDSIEPGDVDKKIRNAKQKAGRK